MFGIHFFRFSVSFCGFRLIAMAKAATAQNKESKNGEENSGMASSDATKYRETKTFVLFAVVHGASNELTFPMEKLAIVPKVEVPVSFTSRK